MDGAQLTLPGLILTNNTPVNAGFGTHGIGFDNTNGLVLLENLNYIRSYNRADPDTIPGVVVNITNFDGPRPVTVWEPIWKEPTMLIPPICNSTEDGTRMDRIDENGEMVPHLYLPNGRRATGVVVAPSMCSVTYNDGIRTELDDPLPGVYMLFTTDAVGAHSPYLRIDPLAPMQTPWDGNSSGSVGAAPIHELNCIMIEHGTATPVPGSSAPGDGGGGGAGTNPGPITAHRSHDAVSKGNAHSNSDPGTCSCREGNPSNNKQAAGRTNTNTGNQHDHNDGDERNAHDAEDVCKGPQWDGNAVMGSDGNWYVEIGGKLYRIKNIGLMREEDNTIIDIGEWSCSAGKYSNLEAVDQEAKESSWWDGVQYGLGVLQGIVGEISDTVTGMLDALGAFIDDPLGFIDEMLSGLGALVDAIRAGDAMGVLERTLPGVAGFIKTHLMKGSEDVSMQDKGKALGRMIVEIAGMFGGGGGGAAGKLIKAIADSIGDVAGVGIVVKKAAEVAANCFVEGTLVWVLRDDVDPEQAEEALRSGRNWQDFFELVPIEQVETGDWVLSRDERDDSAPLVISKVAFTTTRLVDELVDVTVFDPVTSTGGTIQTTPGHPFWTYALEGESISIADTRPHETEGLQYRTTTSGATLTASEGWAFATDLQVGQILEGANHQAGVVAKVREYYAPNTRVYNFAVEGTQTYFVGGRAENNPTPVWVHNNNGKKNPERYNRREHYGNTPKKSDREALGAGSDEVVDHDPPLVKRYYEGDPASGEKKGCEMTDAERQASANDRTRMKVQPKADSNKQGGEMSKYSKDKKKELGLD